MQRIFFHLLLFLMHMESKQQVSQVQTDGLPAEVMISTSEAGLRFESLTVSNAGTYTHYHLLERL